MTRGSWGALVVIASMCLAPLAHATESSDAAGSTGGPQGPLQGPEGTPEPEPSFEGSEIGFCGEGDVDSGTLLVYQIRDVLDAGNVREAHRRIVHALQGHHVTRGSRGPALAILAETQLRLHQYGRAVASYRRAIDAMHATSDDPMLVGYSVALLRSGRVARAHTRASTFARAACTAETPSDPVACYGAHLVLAATSPSSVERTAATEHAAAVRAIDPSLDPSFAQMRELIPAAPGAPRRALLASR